MPHALVNFLGLMAYSLPDGREIFSVEDMVASFDIDRVHLGGPIFDQNKLKWVNQQQIGSMNEDTIYAALADWRFNETFLRKLIPLMHERMHKLGDFMKHCDFMFYSDLEYDAQLLLPKNKDDENTRDFLQMFVWEMESNEVFTAESIEQTARKIGDIHAWKIRDAAHALRVAICGKTVAPPLFQVAEILGRDIVRSRVMAAVNLLGPLGKKKLAKLQKHFDKASAEYVPSES